jgi:hypothetical protein
LADVESKTDYNLMKSTANPANPLQRSVGLSSVGRTLSLGMDGEERGPMAAAAAAAQNTQSNGDFDLVKALDRPRFATKTWVAPGEDVTASPPVLNSAGPWVGWTMSPVSTA